MASALIAAVASVGSPAPAVAKSPFTSTPKVSGIGAIDYTRQSHKVLIKFWLDPARVRGSVSGIRNPSYRVSMVVFEKGRSRPLIRVSRRFRNTPTVSWRKHQYWFKLEPDDAKRLRSARSKLRVVTEVDQTINFGAKASSKSVRAASVGITQSTTNSSLAAPMAASSSAPIPYPYYAGVIPGGQLVAQYFQVVNKQGEILPSILEASQSGSTPAWFVGDPTTSASLSPSGQFAMTANCSVNSQPSGTGQETGLVYSNPVDINVSWPAMCNGVVPANFTSMDNPNVG